MAVSALIPAVTLVSEPFDYRIGLFLSVGLVAAIWAAFIFMSPSIRVTENNLFAGKAYVPRKFIGEVVEIGKDRIFQERGPELDPASYKVFQVTVKAAVKVYLKDPQDPTPYWIISTRKPDKLAKALLTRN